MQAPAAGDRIAALTNASRSLGRFVHDDPDAQAAAVSVDALPTRESYVSGAQAALGSTDEGLVRWKRIELVRIAARDLAGELALEAVGRALSDLADACLEAVTARHASGMSVIAMGKLGGRELNYSSDVDLMFVADDPAAAGAAASDILEVLGGHGPAGQAFRVDMNLRPEGRNGPLIRSLDSYLEYYRRWAHTWEFQALIKARHCAGDADLGARFEREAEGLVYAREPTPEVVESIRRMKERVEDHAQRSLRRSKSPDADDVKLGPGGIRDIEFSVQLLQLVHGGSDPGVRSPNTLEAITQLVGHGYIAEDDAAGLSVDYRWLRNVEHRIQLWQERQLHTLPARDEDRARVARAMGFRDSPSESALQRFDDAHARVLADVRGRFDKLFYRPMIEALADPTAGGLSPEALRERLQVLGFRDVERAARTLDGLVSGTDRRARLFRVLTPAMLRFLTSTPLPDEGLFSFLRFGEAVGGRVDVLGSLRDNPPAIAFLARVLGHGRVLGDLLEQVPDEIAVIADARGPGEPKDRDRLVREAVASLRWRDPEDRMAGLRRFKKREMLRVALADIAAASDVRGVGTSLAALADACLEATVGQIDFPFAVIAMGKLGGRELNYASDIDVMFVHDAAQAEGERAAEDLMRAVGEVTPEGQAFRVDAGLRPEGKSGALARSVDSYIEYYRRWAHAWERQALLKARHAAGDPALSERLLTQVRDAVIADGVDEAGLAEIRHLKARMERERIPRGVDARRHVKLGPGGLSDVEFSVQILQLRHAAGSAGLRTTSTWEALDAARGDGLLDEAGYARLTDAYAFILRLRDRMFFMHGRAGDTLPVKPEELEALGVAMGFEDQPRQELEERYLRVTRRSRSVAERLIYG